MIEGTKPYRPRGTPEKNPGASTTNSERTPEAGGAAAPPQSSVPEHAADATNQIPAASAPPPSRERALGRRDWFRALVPAFGEGLVEILRTSNNFERDLKDLTKRD